MDRYESTTSCGKPSSVLQFTHSADRDFGRNNTGSFLTLGLFCTNTVPCHISHPCQATQTYGGHCPYTDFYRFFN